MKSLARMAVVLALALIAASGCAAPGSRSAPVRAERGWDPASAAVSISEGLAFARAGDMAAAEESFRAAIMALPRSSAAHNNLGNVLMRRNRLSEAAQAYHAAARLDPRAVQPLLNLGKLYERVGWRADALRAYSAALDRDGRNAVAGQRLSLLLGPSRLDSVEQGGALAADEGSHHGSQLRAELLRVSEMLGRTGAAPDPAVPLPEDR